MISKQLRHAIIPFVIQVKQSELQVKQLGNSSKTVHKRKFKWNTRHV